MAGPDNAVRLNSVNHLTYNVTDREAALRFWQEALGVQRISSQADAEHIIWLQLPSGTMVHLVENPDAPSRPSHHAAFEVDDIDATAEALRARGAETSAIEVRKDGQRWFNTFDPDGNRIEICTRSGFGVLV